MFLLFKQELACGNPPKGGKWRMQILFPICPCSSFFVQHSTKVHRLIRTKLLVSWLGRDLPLIFIPKPPVNEQVPTRQTAKHLDIATVFTYSHAKIRTWTIDENRWSENQSINQWQSISYCWLALIGIDQSMINR